MANTVGQNESPASSGVARQAHGEHGRTERVAGVVGIHPTERDQRLEFRAEDDRVGSEESPGDAGAEVVVSGGDGRVGREDDTGTNRSASLVETETLLGHDPSDAFENRERRVTLVEMDHRRFDVDGG